MTTCREELEERLQAAMRHPRAGAAQPELGFAQAALDRRCPLEDVALALGTAEYILGIRREVA